MGLALFFLILRWKITVLHAYPFRLTSKVAYKRDISSLVDDSGKLFVSLLEEAEGSRDVTTLNYNPVLHDGNNSEADALNPKTGCANWHCSVKFHWGESSALLI